MGRNRRCRTRTRRPPGRCSRAERIPPRTWRRRPPPRRAPSRVRASDTACNPLHTRPGPSRRRSPRHTRTAPLGTGRCSARPHTLRSPRREQDKQCRIGRSDSHRSRARPHNHRRLEHRSLLALPRTSRAGRTRRSSRRRPRRSRLVASCNRPRTNHSGICHSPYRRRLLRTGRHRCTWAGRRCPEQARPEVPRPVHRAPRPAHRAPRPARSCRQNTRRTPTRDPTRPAHLRVESSERDSWSLSD